MTADDVRKELDRRPKVDPHEFATEMVKVRDRAERAGKPMPDLHKALEDFERTGHVYLEEK